jgi:hypothetical protein
MNGGPLAAMPLPASHPDGSGKASVHGVGDAVHGDGHRDSGVVLRGARLDLRLVAEIVTVLQIGHVSAGQGVECGESYGPAGPFAY